jgi:hypothetical protein
VITTRRYTKQDIPALVGYLREALKPLHYGPISFSPVKVENLLVGNLTSKKFFCELVVDGDEILGAMVASVVEFPFSYEAYASDYITWIRPEKRSLKAITSLVAKYVEWANERRVTEIRWSQSSGFKMDKFEKLASRLGFVKIGTHFMMDGGK